MPERAAPAARLSRRRYSGAGRAESGAGRRGPPSRWGKRGAGPGNGASPPESSCGDAGREGRGGSAASLEFERPFKMHLSLEVLFVIIHLVRRVLPGGLGE